MANGNVKILCEVEFHYSDNCNDTDVAKFNSDEIMRVYGMVADRFNVNIPKWNDAFELTHPNRNWDFKGSNYDPKYENYICRRMEPVCKKVNDISNSDIIVKPFLTSDGAAWYIFKLREDETKTCYFNFVEMKTLDGKTLFRQEEE